MLSNFLRNSIALGLRQVFIQLVNFFSGVIFARTLLPEMFGAYSVIMFFSGAIMVLSDSGIASGIIRSDKKPEKGQLSALFTLQQAIVLIMSLVLVLFSGNIEGKFLNVDNGRLSIIIVVISTMVASLQNISFASLERESKFERIAAIEVFQAIMYNLLAIILIKSGYGIVSFAIAILFRSTLGFAMFWLSWRFSPRINFDFSSISDYIKFGFSYQLTSILSIVNASINPIIINSLLGLTIAGRVSWSIILVGYLQQPVSLLSRILFPLYSRVQEDKARLSYILNATYFVTSAAYFGLASVFFVCLKDIILIAYTSNWLTSLEFTRLLLLTTIFLPLSIPNGALALALGLSGLLFRINLVKSAIFISSNLVLFFFFRKIEVFILAQFISETIHLYLYVVLRGKLIGIHLFKNQLPFFASFILIVIISNILKTDSLGIENLRNSQLSIFLAKIVATTFMYAIVSFFLVFFFNKEMLVNLYKKVLVKGFAHK